MPNPNNDKLKQAYAHCQNIANSHYENFPTASLLIRSDLRPAIAVIYAFARTADDFADEGVMAADERLRLLDDWEAELDKCLTGQSEHLIFIALADVMQHFDLPVQLFRDLLIAFRMDVNFKGFTSLDDLLIYCKHSANPVGRLMLLLHGIHDEKAFDASDAICSALQLTNFWQDFSIDIPKGRCYLADEWLTLSQVSRDEVLSGSVDDAQLKPSITEAIHATQQLFDFGFALLTYLPLRLRLQIAATLAGGMRILSATAHLPNPLLQRPTLKTWDWLKVSLNIVLFVIRPQHYAKRAKHLAL